MIKYFLRNLNNIKANTEANKLFGFDIWFLIHMYAFKNVYRGYIKRTIRNALKRTTTINQKENSSFLRRPKLFLG